MHVRVSDLPVYDWCPMMFYLQRVRNYFPKKLVERLNKGVEEHSVFEQGQLREHEPPVKGEPYTILVQEQLLKCSEHDLAGKPDQVVIKGTAYNNESDHRSLIVIDKKSSFHKSYLYQLWGYAYLVRVDGFFDQYKPFKILTAIVCDDFDDSTKLYPYTAYHEHQFFTKLSEFKKAYLQMLAGQVPGTNFSGKCEHCAYQNECEKHR